MKTAIIGGGIGGLMSALILSKRGIEVEIFEKDSRLGGRLRFVERDGFKIDQGPTIVLLPEMFQNLLDEAGIDMKMYELLLCDPLYTIHFPDGISYTKYPDEERQLEELRRVFPEDAEKFPEFIRDGKERFTVGKEAFLSKSFSDHKSFWTKSNVKKLMKLKPYQSVNRLMGKYFQDERLRMAYSLQTLYIGGDPYHAPAMYSLIPYSEHAHGIYYLKGGYANLVDILKKEIEKRNIPVHLNCPVTSIHTENQEVKGIQTKFGQKRYDAIIYNGDFPNLEDLMDVPGKRAYTPSSGCVLLYFGLNKVYKEADVHQFFIGNSFANHMKAVFEQKSIPDDPAIYTFHPSIIDDSLAPEGKGVLYTLIPVPSDTEVDWRNQQEWIDKIIERMEKGAFPGLRNAIEWMEMYTPKDAEAFGLYKGGSFGIAPSLFQSGVFRPQVKSKTYNNLYAVGASIHPGGGIPIVMQGAKLLADELIKDQIQRGGRSIHA
ncbi:phytoene desaturase family protein [Falsibacillus pallidus]|uniref:phytoene desaturase family protein n=1 Tax=Falsibacillus pallidus TaxID=493781 RepID=UPI003D99BFB8